MPNFRHIIYCFTSTSCDGTRIYIDVAHKYDATSLNFFNYVVRKTLPVAYTFLITAAGMENEQTNFRYKNSVINMSASTNI